MAKVLFIPFSFAGSMLAGVIASKVFGRIWALIDDQEPPDAEHRKISWLKLVPAVALEGAIFRLARAVTDHGARVAFHRATGAWPGEERPEPE